MLLTAVLAATCPAGTIAAAAVLILLTITLVPLLTVGIPGWLWGRRRTGSDPETAQSLLPATLGTARKAASGRRALT